MRSRSEFPHWIKATALLLACLPVYFISSVHASTQSIQAAVLKQIKDAVSASDALKHERVLDNRDVAAFYPCYRNARAAHEVVRRFRNVYPNASLHMWMDDGGDVEAIRAIADEYNAHAVHLPRRLGVAMWATTYHYADDFVEFFWNGLRTAARFANRVLVLEDDAWVLRPMHRVPNDAAAVAGPSRALDEYAAALRSECKRPHIPALRTGGGGTVLSSAWIRSVPIDAVKRAAEIVLHVNRGRIPSDLAVSVLLACEGRRVETSETQVVSVDHDYASLIQSPWTPVRVLNREIELISSGRVSVLHKIRLYYD